MELDAGIAIQIGNIVDDKLAPMHKRMDKDKLPKPIRRRFGGSGIAVASTVLNVQAYPACAAGRMWEIRLIRIFGNDGHTVVAGTTADIYAGTTQDENTTDFQGLILSGVPIPTVKDYGRRHITLYNNDQVYALVTGAAANQQIVLTGEADEYILDDVEATHIPEARKRV